MKIAVVGLGKIGLPLAVQYASKGHDVVGVDISERTVSLINAGQEPFPGEQELAERLYVQVQQGRLKAVTSFADAVPSANAVVVVVPLYVDEHSQPDFRTMDEATISVGKHLRSGTLVSFETTLPIGTTRTRLTPILSQESGLIPGEDFYVVFSPERVLTGRVFSDLRRYPKLVGGIDVESTRVGIDFYTQVLDFDDRPDLKYPNGVWDMGTCEASEFAKLAETTYRDVNIGLANQFALYAETHGIDLYKVIDASNSQPYSHIHRPGVAVGGHCIPVYPRLYLFNDPNASIVSAAREANAAMPANLVARMIREFGSLAGHRVAVLGAAYRGGVKETAFSGVFDLVQQLEREQATVLVHDPLYEDSELQGMGFTPFHRGSTASFVVVQADHSEYSQWGSGDIPGVTGVVDGRNVLNHQGWTDARILTLGVDGSLGRSTAQSQTRIEKG